MISHAGVYSVFEVDGNCEPTEKMIGYLYYTGPDLDINKNTPARIMHASFLYNATITNIMRWGHWCLVDFSVTEFPVVMMFYDFSGRGHCETVYVKRLPCEPRESEKKNVRRVEL